MCSAASGVSAALGGIFVGGKSTRMGGSPKGLLTAPEGGTVIARWARLFAGLSIPVVLVGESDAYATAGIEQLADAASGMGPLGGLIALLERAGPGHAIAVACDMPYVSPSLLAKLAHHPSGAHALAPRDEARWDPLFARFRTPDALALARDNARRGRLSLQALLDALGAEPLPLDPGERALLRDWDTPDDIERA
jgi:molybdopterin-guanine dinucleotide biosynthesis protein A